MKPTAAQKERFNRVAALACLKCGRKPVHIHHCRHECGMGQRNHDHIAPLCEWCHQLSPEARHAAPRDFARYCGTDRELHERTKQLLGEEL